MLNLEENPPAIFPDTALTDAFGQWWVAHTKARREKALAWELHAHKIAYFLPMILRNKVWGGRKRKVLKPLFTSYLFFCGDEKDRITAFGTDHLCGTLVVPQPDKFLNELHAIKRALSENVDLEIDGLATPGRRCRVKQGPLKGIEGTVVQRQGRTRLVLNVTVVGRGTSLEIDGDLLEALD
jgi:transcription termination/antitermination protein NusG